MANLNYYLNFFYLKSVISRQPLFYLLIAFSFCSTGKTQNDLIPISPNQISVIYFEKGKQEFLLGNYKKAIALFNKAIEIQPKLKEVNYQAGLAEYNLKDFVTAIVYFTTEINNNDKHLSAYIFRGISEDKIQDYKAALNDLNKANKINKKNDLVYLERANILFHTNEYKKAIIDYTTALALNPKLELAYYQMGFCNFYLKDTLSACENWKKISDIDDFKGYEKVEKICNQKH